MIQRRYILQLPVLFGLALIGLWLATAGPRQVRADANISLDVTPASQVVGNGEDVTLSLAISNTNASAINIGNVTINHALGGRDCDTLIGPGGDDGDDLLEPGEVWNYNCTITGMTATFTFTAQVNGVLQDGFSTAVSANDSATVTLATTDIGIRVTDGSGGTKTVAEGGNVSFQVRVRNNGTVTLNNITFDDNCDSLTPFDPPTLAPGAQTPQLICQLNNVTDGRIVSIEVTGTPATADPDVSDDLALTAIITEIAEICPIGPSASVDMLAYWKLDETGGLDIDDYYSDHNGTCNGTGGVCPSFQTQGQVKGARIFDGASTRINVPHILGDNAFAWDENDSFSIELWMKGIPGQTCKPGGIPNNEVMIGRSDRSGDARLQWWLGCVSGSGQARFHLQDVAGNEFRVESPQSIIDGQWHHLVAVRDGAAKINRLYVDGAQAAFLEDTIYPFGFDSDVAEINIGWLDLPGLFNYEGELDEIAIYNKALPLSEITAHYQSGAPLGGYCGDKRPLITSTPVITGVVGQAYGYDVEAIGNPVPTYTLSISPTGMAIDSVTGVISWTPGSSGQYDVTVIASNEHGTDDQAFKITVVPPNSPPDIISEPITSTTIGQVYSYTVIATGDPAPTYSLIIMPEGMTIDPTTGVISWTPTSSGIFDVTVRASNSEGSEDQAFKINVGDVSAPGATDVFLPIVIKNKE